MNSGAIFNIPLCYVDKNKIQKQSLNPEVIEAAYECAASNNFDSLMLRITKRSVDLVMFRTEIDSNSENYIEATGMYCKSGALYKADTYLNDADIDPSDVSKFFNNPYDTFTTFARALEDYTMTVYVSIVKIEDIGYCYKYIVVTTNNSFMNLMSSALQQYIAVCPKISYYLDKMAISSDGVELVTPSLDKSRSFRASDEILFSVFMSLKYTFDMLRRIVQIPGEDGEPESQMIIPAGWYLAQWMYDFGIRLAKSGIDISPLVTGEYLGLSECLPVKLVHSFDAYNFVLSSYGCSTEDQTIRKLSAYYKHIDEVLGNKDARLLCSTALLQESFPR